MQTPKFHIQFTPYTQTPVMYILTHLTSINFALIELEFKY